MVRMDEARFSESHFSVGVAFRLFLCRGDFYNSIGAYISSRITLSWATEAYTVAQSRLQHLGTLLLL